MEHVEGSIVRLLIAIALELQEAVYSIYQLRHQLGFALKMDSESILVPTRSAKKEQHSRFSNRIRIQ